MTATRSRRRRRHRSHPTVHKPTGAFQPRVQAVGPDLFGIVAVDCAKARCKWLLADFYGNLLIPPTTLSVTRPDLDAALDLRRRTADQHQLRDLVVAVERTGRYHHPILHAFRAAGYDTRVVHPFATKQLRQPADPGNKTDDTDLAAIHRAAVNGFALIDTPLDEQWETFKLLVRHRRDLVHKTAALRCQIAEHLEAAWPGYAALFVDLWRSDIPFVLIRHFAAPAALAAAGRAGIETVLRLHNIQFHYTTPLKISNWATQAATPDVGAAARCRIALALEDDRLHKTQQILRAQRDLAHHLTRTPYVLLLSFPGINVVSAADFAGEMGPMQRYANARTISGRAGLCPSRYQSDLVDRADGPLIRCGNRQLRCAILTIADNLILHNSHFRNLALSAGDPRRGHVKVASRFCRIAYQLVAGGQVLRHPAIKERAYLLDKLLAFHREHQSPAAEALADLQAAVAQLPGNAYREEARPLADELERLGAGRRRGPQLLGDILPIVLAKLGVVGIQSGAAGEDAPR